MSMTDYSSWVLLDLKTTKNGTWPTYRFNNNQINYYSWQRWIIYEEVMIIIHAEDSEILANPPDGLQYFNILVLDG